VVSVAWLDIRNKVYGTKSSLSSSEVPNDCSSIKVNIFSKFFR